MTHDPDNPANAGRSDDSGETAPADSPAGADDQNAQGEHENQDNDEDDDGPVLIADPTHAGTTLRERIAVLPGDERAAYRPGVVMVKVDVFDQHIAARQAAERDAEFDSVERVFAETPGAEDALGIWWKFVGVRDPLEWVEFAERLGLASHVDWVYFANEACRCGCPPHPSTATMMASPWSANPWSANPWSANPWSANPWSANPWSANPWSANAEALNVAVTGKPPTNSAMPALDPQIPTKPVPGNGVVVGILDSGLAGVDDGDPMRPDFLKSGLITGELDVPSAPINGHIDGYLDPVAGHGTFIAGIIQQRTPGCTIHVARVFYPEGDVSTSWLAPRLWDLVVNKGTAIVNLSFGGAGMTKDGLFESVIEFFAARGVVFVAAAGNEGTCVEQFPAALPEVIAVAALGPRGPAPWSNYGAWVNASAPGTDLISSFFANFDGALPRINGMDPDNFKGWATWSGTSFAAPVVVAALAREMATTGCTANAAVERVVRAPHLARLPYMGTIVNY